jgi:hypothetical protein
MQKASLLQLQKDIEKLKKAVNHLNQKSTKKFEAIIIEEIDESNLTAKQKKELTRIIYNLKHNKKNEFLTLDELMVRYKIKA